MMFRVKRDPKTKYSAPGTTRVRMLLAIRSCSSVIASCTAAAIR